MKTIMTVLLLVLLGGRAFGSGEYGEENRNPSRDFEIGLLQFAGAEGCGGGCMAAGAGIGFYSLLFGLLFHFGPDISRSQSQSDADAIFVVGALLGGGCVLVSPVASGLSATAIGDRFYSETSRGSLGWSIGGAYSGLAAAGAIAASVGLLGAGESGVGSAALIGSFLVLPQVGAVLGYQWSRADRVQALNLNRFEPTRVAVTMGRHAGRPALGLNACLLSYHF